MRLERCCLLPFLHPVPCKQVWFAALAPRQTMTLLLACLTTGLDVENDTIIEIACILTDGDIKQVIEVRFRFLVCALEARTEGRFSSGSYLLLLRNTAYCLLGLEGFQDLSIKPATTPATRPCICRALR